MTRKNSIKRISALVAVAFTITACGTNPATGAGTFNRSDASTVIGGVVGAIAGGQFGDGRGKVIASIGGGLLGAYIGNRVENHLTEHDKLKYRVAELEANKAPIGETVEWYNPESGNQGTITPVREGETASGRYCREYQQTITIGGKLEEAYGQACQQPDGSWEIIG